MERKLVAKHVMHVGEVIHAYNRAHASLFMLFMRVGFEDNHEIAQNVWHTVQSDKTQRQMLEAVVRSKLKDGSMKSGILWALSALNELSIFRNDATHAAMMWYYDVLIPGFGTRPQTRERLEALPLEKHWKALRGDLNAITHYLAFLGMGMDVGSPRPLSRRPRLQLARSTSSRSQEARRRAKKATRERQRQSSRK